MSDGTACKMKPPILESHIGQPPFINTHPSATYLTGAQANSTSFSPPANLTLTQTHKHKLLAASCQVLHSMPVCQKNALLGLLLSKGKATDSTFISHTEHPSLPCSQSNKTKLFNWSHATDTKGIRALKQHLPADVARKWQLTVP